MTNTHPEHSAGRLPLPPQVEQYLQFTKDYEEALSKKDETATAQAKRVIEIFLGTLTEKEQKEVEIFLKQESSGLRIRDYQIKTRGLVANTLRGTSSTTRSAAEIIPEFAEYSGQLISGTIVGLMSGFVNGAKKALRKHNQSA